MKDKRDAYTMMKVAEMAAEMKACYEDATRTRGFDPATNIRTIRMREVMEEGKVSAIMALTKLIPGLGEWTARAEAQEAYRDLMASAYYIIMVEGLPKMTVVK